LPDTGELRPALRRDPIYKAGLRGQTASFERCLLRA